MKRKAVKISEYLLIVVLALIFFYISFRNLDVAAVANSDEARHGVSAYEMLQTGNWIENTFNYEKETDCTASLHDSVPDCSAGLRVRGRGPDGSRYLCEPPDRG